MKLFKQLSKTALLCVMLIFTRDAYSQILPTTFTTSQGQCVDVVFDTMGFSVTTFNVLSGPFNGQLIPGIRPGSWIYCPDSSFIGTDQATVYECLSGPTFPVCDTLALTFIVQQSGGCNLSVTIQNGPCAGPLPSLMATANGGTPPYQYLWSNAVTGDVVCNLTTGTYCVTVFDANNCSVSSCQSVTSGGCNMTVTLYPDSTPCMGPLPSIGSFISGGTPPYTYWWSTGDSTPFICNLTPGNYFLTVTDAQGCIDSAFYRITGCQLAVSTALDSSGCLITTVTGGTPPYTYQWSDGSTSSTICNVNPLPNYTVTVTDMNGCTGTATYSSGGCQLFSTITQSGSCLSVIATGGTPPYNYIWDDSSLDPTICPNFPGTYCVTITDAQGCNDFICGTTTGGCQITTTVVLDSINSCVSTFTTGGTPPYTYLWADGDSGATNCFIFLTPNACVTVTDANGCDASDCYSGGCPLQVVIFLDSSGCLTTNVTGGSSPYSYSWSDGEIGATICPAGFPGVYCLTVTDANNCFGTACFNYQPAGSCSFAYTQVPSSPVAIVFTASLDSSLNQAGIQWDFGDGSTATGTTVTHIYNRCNVYLDVTMTAVDSNGSSLCSFTHAIFISCFPNSFCQARFAASQDSIDDLAFHFADLSVYNPVSFAWDFGDGNSSTLQNPSYTFDTAGIYNVCLTVTDSNGCTSTFCKQIIAGNFQVYDLTAYLHHNTTVTPGFQLWTRLTFCNNGTTIRSGTVEYRYPAGTFPAPGTSFVAHDTAQRLLTFSFSNLLPGDCRTIAVTLTVDMTLQLGSVACDTMWVKPIVGDINPSNNVSTVCDIVVGSWDPNDKSNSPKGLGDDGEIPVGTKDLSYLIRFQNTGSAPAQQVEIRDMIDSNIDLTSVKVSEASHAHITQIIGNELVVTFNDIQLPDSNANEPASHGYIVVNTTLKPGLTAGTQIFNTADIYFDFNPAVITNTVVNTLKDTVSGIRPAAGLEFSILPNPAQNEIVINGKFSRNSTFEIINGPGQILLSGEVNSDKTRIVIDHLQTGIYFVKIKSKDKTGVQRLVVTE